MAHLPSRRPLVVETGLFRPGDPKDFEHVRFLSRVFEPYGNYAETLPLYLIVGEVATWVLETERAGVVGFIQYTLEDHRRFRGVVANILAVAVEPAFQGRGYGTILFEGVFHLVARSVENAVGFCLTVADTNLRARRLFERLGFAWTGRILGKYDGGQDALEMFRPLRDEDRR